MTPEQQERVRELWVAGNTYGDIAAALGVTRESVRWVVRQRRHEWEPQRMARAVQPPSDDELRRRNEAAELRQLRREIEEATSLAAMQRRILDLARELLTPPAPPRERATGRPKLGGRELIAVPLHSDWHDGYLATIEATGGVFAQSSEITHRQIDLWMRRFGEAVEAKRSAGYAVRTAWNAWIGDLTEGELRPRAIAETDQRSMEQAVDVFHLMAEQIRFQRHDLGLVVEGVVLGGNHDRGRDKAGLAGLGELGYTETLVWLVGQLLVYYHSRDQGVRLEVPATFWHAAIIGGLRAVMEHGASIRWSSGSYGGVPWYGVVNAVRAYAEMLEGADLVMIGHGHQPAVITRGRTTLIANGSFLPASTYTQSRYKTISQPQQWLLWIEPGRGLVDMESIDLDVGQTAPPGAVWRQLRGEEEAPALGRGLLAGA